MQGGPDIGKITTAIYTGRPGRSPLDPAVWSSSSRSLFTRMDALGVLNRAIGVELDRPGKVLQMLVNFSPRRDRWKTRFQLSPGYRDAMTGFLDGQLTDDERLGPFLQIGAMFDATRLMKNPGTCYSYHDGCLAERLASPLPFPRISRQRIDRALEYERRVCGGMAKVFTFSEYLRRSMVKHNGLQPERVVVVGGGINLGRLPEPDASKRYDTQSVLFIGVDFKRKGGEHLLRAFAAVRHALPKATLQIVGPRALVGFEPLPDGVTVHGFLNKSNPVDAARLDRLFRDASLFVLPSLYEPFGIAPLEAMAYQLPCLVSNGWALAETVTDGVNGELVEPGNADDLAQKMAALLADPDRLRTLGAAAGRYVDTCPSWETVARRIAVEMGAL